MGRFLHKTGSFYGVAGCSVTPLCEGESHTDNGMAPVSMPSYLHKYNRVM
ncbi:hypothetical protein TREPR_3754 [Treponema primitia ZAS-2]|uniref:Uncharacterized protein n=1 Tax=Treponema primitia (strain ATCC BAA-887 / DSM 12427 / ZAS-2) TaxID=545694 RepID=F5YQ91_TREPZ|nr:hypothetical protein TREPR_3754 [Treponema primitia ZAS-2]